ncbi:MAG TPA: hypothetical protein VEC57_00105 [Candidatus Limnocylindrales bacterium]|nr:hypothetical protein [Candidatus Limnocylindrales bacterium]
MIQSQRQKHYEERIREKMLPLVGMPAFEAFMAVLRESREASIADSLMDSVIANQRNHLAAIGEIRCFTSILSIYDAAVEQHRTAKPEEVEGD